MMSKPSKGNLGNCKVLQSLEGAYLSKVFVISKQMPVNTDMAMFPRLSGETSKESLEPLFASCTNHQPALGHTSSLSGYYLY